MELSNKGITNQIQWKEKEYQVPCFNREEVIKKTKEAPIWLHFGYGNIFRAFPAMLMQELIEKGEEDRGIIAAEGYDYEIIDKVNKKCDDLSILVTLKGNGDIQKTIVESVTESLKTEKNDFNRLKQIFSEPSLQLVSFTITEKGYSLIDRNGKVLREIEEDFLKGPEEVKSYLGKVASLCFTRYLNGQKPLALVSLDNCSKNGEKLYEAINMFAYKWYKNEKAPKDFYDYINNKKLISFPCTMIDKITPRPSEEIESILKNDGIENLSTIITSKNTYISNFINAEEAQYLVIEDNFPNGRPNLEKVGVIFTDKETVEKAERMKVSTCLNPIHTALAILGCLLSYETIYEEMEDDDLRNFVKLMVYKESLKVVEDPKVIDPEKFLNDVIENRLPNKFIPDTPQRIATDTSKKMSVRFSQTIKAYYEKKELDVNSLKLIPFVIAAWCRYLIGIDDEGRKIKLSPDPMLSVLTSKLSKIELGKEVKVEEYLKPILSDKEIFEINLYEVGIGRKIEDLFSDLIKEKGSVRKMLKEVNSKYD